MIEVHCVIDTGTKIPTFGGEVASLEERFVGQFGELDSPEAFACLVTVWKTTPGIKSIIIREAALVTT